jgi:hypothetical protein
MLMPEYFSTAVPGIGPPMVFGDLWYIGVAPLLLAGVALLQRPFRHVWLWAGLALIAVLVTYGIGPFLYLRWLPGLNALVPSRIGYLLIFGLCVLAGIGYDALVGRSQKGTDHAISRTIWPMGALCVASVAAFGYAWVLYSTEQDPAHRALKESQLGRGIVWAALSLALIALLRFDGIRIRRGQRATPVGAWYALSPLWGAALLLAVSFDLLTAVPGYNSFVDPDDVAPQFEAINRLRSAHGQWRVMGIDSPMPVLNPNTQTLYGFDSVHGYDSLHTRRYEEFWATVDPGVLPKRGGGPYSNVFIRPQVYTSTPASLLGVRYITSAVPLTTAAVANLTIVYSKELIIYENPNALPRTFIVPKARVASAEEIKALLAAEDFDPRQVVLLEEEPTATAPVEDAGVATAQGRSPTHIGASRITVYRRNSVQIEVDLRQPAWLVLADPNYPGWQVSVDGRAQKIYTAYLLLRAVPLTAGKHVVTFTFVPTTLVPAGTISALTLALLGMLILKRPRPRPKIRTGDERG